LRLFVAVELPTSVRRALGELVRDLARCGADVKWVEEENFHITLKFLGEVDPARLPEVQAALVRATRGAKPFSFEAAGTGAFPSPARPRVLWVGVGRGAEELGSLAARVDGELARVGFAPEARAFSPHLTIGRVRSPRGMSDLVDAMERACFPAREVLVEEIVLFRSTLGRAGPVYTPVARYRLS
jgi:2'-5' RNA ligase